MKRWFLVVHLLLLAVVSAGCGQSIPLEDLTISLILGVDLDDEENLIISESSPVFDRNAKKKVETYQIKAKSIRESRKYFDALATGRVTAAKIQVLLVGKRVLEHEDWFAILDTVYRNPTFSINTKVIMVDGPVSDVIFYETDNKPILPLFLKELIDKNIERTRTVTATLQVLHRQMYEKGITPSISQIKKSKEIELVGVSLLNKKGKYVDTLNILESTLLIILRDGRKRDLTLSVPISSIEDAGGIFHKNELSIDIGQLRSKVTTQYEQNKFHFKFNIRMTVDMIERLFPMEGLNENELEMMIEKEVKARFEALIKKFQEYKIDPIGLGLYARAYHYDEYKKVEEHWGEALAAARIDVNVDIKIEAMGATK